MSTVAEIEAAIEHLPPSERRRLREKLFSEVPASPKTGAELAKLWPGRFHLHLDEADALAADINEGKKISPQPPAWK
jgi:hypothetical protein